VKKLIAISILALLAESGCRILSSGYDNFATYFNAYYNARRLFNEAESEIQENIQQSRPRAVISGNSAIPIPGDARTKLVSVIEKGSTILSFHPNSAYVENALYLIGRSYFYLEEYVKAERKFTELISQFPDGSLADDAYLWLSKTELSLNKLEDALRIAKVAEDVSRSRGEAALVHQVLMLTADVLLVEGDTTHALESMERAEQIPLKGDAEALDLIKQGTTYAAASQYRDAIKAYSRVSEFTSDAFINFQSKQQLLVALRKLEEYDAGLEVANEAAYDIRFQEFFPAIRFERALLRLGLRDTLGGISELQQLDSSGERTALSGQVALTLGNHFEFNGGDFRLAQRYYSKASLAPDFPQSAFAARRSEGLTKILTFAGRWADSSGMLRALVQSAQVSDSLRNDSLSARIDSIRTGMAITAADLGDTYFSELNRTDSADAWFSRSIAMQPNSDRAPRNLFIRAEIARTDSLRKDSAVTFYRKLATQFPGTVYGAEARRFLGLEQARNVVDTSAVLYGRAERMIETGRNKEALQILESIVSIYPKSERLVQSEYAAAWLFEQRLNKHDSALARYTHIAKEHPASTYAAAARQKIIEPVLVAAPDSLHPSRILNSVDSLQQKTMDEDEILRNRNQRIKKLGQPSTPTVKEKVKEE
jgi:TolA-binding protein